MLNFSLSMLHYPRPLLLPPDVADRQYEGQAAGSQVCRSMVADAQTGVPP